MATAKKTHTTKKSSKKIVKARPLTWKFYVTTIGIFIIAVSTVVVIALLAAHLVGNQQAKARLDKIQAVYSSLELNNDEYPVVDANVFGAKKTYEWDKNRTYSSSMQYVHGDTVTNTFNELDAKIREAGFKFIDEPYPGTVSKQYHYKSEKGEYIRLTVSSKLYDDAVFNASLLNQSVPSTVDQAGEILNQSPANVTIKVNLDDNNE